MPYTESQRKANKASYERNKEVRCLREKVKYWNNSSDRETMKIATKRNYYKAQIKKLEELLNALPPDNAVQENEPPTI
jgi:hypothetical protein